MSRRIRKSSIKFLIPLVLMFMLVGFATISTTLSINGDMELLSDLDDFNIYYSRAIVNGVEDTSIIKSSTELDFGAALKTVGVDYVIEYDITNASSAFDAQVSINCSASTEYFSINNEFDSETPIGARQTRTGTMTLRKIQTVAGDEQSNTISCDIVATPVERNEEGVGEIPIPLENPYYIGREIAIGEEKFNIISDNGDTVTVLAQYNLGEDYRQTTIAHYVQFADKNGWSNYPGPQEIDIQVWSTNHKTYVNEYVSYLQTETGDITLSGNLITLNELKSLGCTINDDYSTPDNGVLKPTDPNYVTLSCEESLHANFLINGQNWLTRSACSNHTASHVWYITADGDLGIKNVINTMGGEVPVRPTITISKEIVYALIKYKTYDIGEEISIGSEKFNVISQTPTTVKMLAQYNLGTDYRQSEDANPVTFADVDGWITYPGPKEIDIQTWTTNPKTYVSEYIYFLQEEIGDSTLSGDLITLLNLKNLGCDIVRDDYNLKTGDSLSCSESPYFDWLINGQKWWTKSAVADSPSSQVLNVYGTGSIELSSVLPKDAGGKILPGTASGVRPVITVNKVILMNLGI